MPLSGSREKHAGAITVMVMLAAIMQALDTTIANVALPHMRGSLSATQDQITWVLTSYIVASAIMTMPTSWLAGRFGRKRVFLISVVGFTIISALCGVATSLEQMVFYRLLQGAFGAALIPISQAILLDTYPREKHGSAMAMWGMGIMVGPILGPTLGGYLTENYDWRWVFYINVPVGILSTLGIAAFLPETEKVRRPFDWFGFISLGVFIGAIQMILDRGEQVDWFNSAEIITYCGIAAGSLWMFIVHSRYAEHPFLSAELFRDRNLVASLLFIFAVGIVLLATLALLPPFMQTLMGYPVETVGYLMAPRGMGTMVAMMIVGRLLGRQADPRPIIFVGLLCTAVSLWQMSRFSTFVPGHLVVTTGIIQGFGLGFIFVPLSTIAFSTLDSRHRNEAAGLYSLVRNIGSSVGVSIVVTLLSQSTQTNHSYLAEHVTPYVTGIAQHTMPQALGNDTASLFSLLNLEVTRQAATIGYINDFYMMMWIALAGIPLVMLLRNPNAPVAEEVVELEELSMLE